MKVIKTVNIVVTLLLFITCICAFAACGCQDDNDPFRVYDSELTEFIANFEKHTSFSDNQVIVILTEELSFEKVFHDYTTEDFAGIGAIDVEELDGATADFSGLTYRIRQCLLADPTGNTIPEHLKHYQRYFCITLDKKDENNVLRAIYVLRQRADIYFADPNWLESIDV